MAIARTTISISEHVHEAGKMRAGTHFRGNFSIYVEALIKQDLRRAGAVPSLLPAAPAAPVSVDAEESSFGEVLVDQQILAPAER